MTPRTQHLSAADTAKFAVAVAFAAIFIDAAIGHGFTWENDPYWTYWITKTFLIATVFGLGTAWFGIGAGRGALITVVHTLVLTIYYWTFSPIGLPSTPTWLDFEHTWVTGLPIHLVVIYVGYLLALWAWRRRRINVLDIFLPQPLTRMCISELVISGSCHYSLGARLMGIFVRFVQ